MRFNPVLVAYPKVHRCGRVLRFSMCFGCLFIRHLHIPYYAVRDYCKRHLKTVRNRQILFLGLALTIVFPQYKNGDLAIIFLFKKKLTFIYSRTKVGLFFYIHLHFARKKSEKARIHRFLKKILRKTHKTMANYHVIGHELT